jgi:hypothetical protein
MELAAFGNIAIDHLRPGFDIATVCVWVAVRAVNAVTVARRSASGGRPTRDWRANSGKVT